MTSTFFSFLGFYLGLSEKQSISILTLKLTCKRGKAAGIDVFVQPEGRNTKRNPFSMCRESRRLAGDGAAKILVDEKSVAMVLTALFLLLFSGSLPNQPTGVLSTKLTGFNSPTFLQQFAFFAALRDVAEEEHLDWGAPFTLGRSKVCELRLRLDEAREAGEKERKLDEESSTLFGDTGSHLSSLSAKDGMNSGGSSASSRRRPHRRRHNVKKAAIIQGDNDTALSTVSSTSQSERGDMSTGGDENESSRKTLGTAFVAAIPTICVWSQLHAMEVALSTHDNNFIHITQRFLQYEQMYPIVYCCNLHDLQAAHEQELLDAPTTGLEGSRFWSCGKCGKAHDAVREACTRCRHRSGKYAKLFFGQTIKEADCARSVLRLLHATHPEVTVHRIETHRQRSGRGRGCASVYVNREAVQDLVDKLNGNVFFDINESGCMCVHYVYRSQQLWIAALIDARRTQLNRPNTFPCGALVVEEPIERGRGAPRSIVCASSSGTPGGCVDDFYE